VNPLNSIGKKFKQTNKSLQMTWRFLLYYILLIFLPMLLFISWYSMGLVRERQTEQRYERQLMLDHSAEYFASFLQQATFVHDTLQSNSALLSLLENNLYSISKEVDTYQTQIRPTIASILSSNYVVDEIFIYRKTPSQSLNYADMVYFLQDIENFNYGAEVEGQLNISNSYCYLALDPETVRRRDMDTFSPKLIFFTNLYGRNYSKVVGLLEVQMDLDTVLQALDYISSNDALYLKYEGLYYRISYDGRNHYLSAQTQPITALPDDSGSMQTLVSAVKGTEMEIVARFYLDASQWQQIIRYIVQSGCFLLLPTSLFCFIIYRYASRLLKFSRHIRHTDRNGLAPYNNDKSADEIGTVVMEYNQMIDSLRHAEQLKNDANYYALASQINPHFIFNTLENVRMRIEIAQHEEASDMLFILSRFLRYNISLRRESTLLDELTHIRNYLQIYHYRQSCQILFTVDIPDDFANFRCPFCILQPIVENSMKHGQKLGEPLTITVCAFSDEDMVYVEVFDSGKGMSGQELEDLNQKLQNSSEERLHADGSIGLMNVNYRLKYFYGDRCGLRFRLVENGLICTASFVREGFETDET